MDRSLLRRLDQLTRDVLDLQRRTANLPVRPGKGRGVAHAAGFWAKLGAATSIGSNRWRYPFTEQKVATAGAFLIKPGGRTGTAYNTVEANNTSSGVQGNGVDLANLPAGVEIQPLGAGAVVWVREATDCNTGATVYLIDEVNAVDGACS